MTLTPETLSLSHGDEAGYHKGPASPVGPTSDVIKANADSASYACAVNKDLPRNLGELSLASILGMTVDNAPLGQVNEISEGEEMAPPLSAAAKVARPGGIMPG